MTQPLPKKIPDELINNKSVQVRDYFQRLTNGAYFLWEQTKNITGSGNVTTLTTNVTTLTTNVGLLNTVKDLTSATEDYSLSVNETAKIDISAASTDLHIALEDGVYEIRIVFDVSTFAADQNLTLFPNGTTHAGEFSTVGLIADTGIATDEVDVQTFSTADRFVFGTLSWVSAYATLVIFGNTRIIDLSGRGTASGSNRQMFINGKWTSSTAFTSLTLDCGEAATGVCYFKRIA